MKILKEKNEILIKLNRKDSCSLVKDLGNLHEQNVVLKDKLCSVEFALSSKISLFSRYENRTDLFVLSNNDFSLIQAFLHSYCQNGQGQANHIDLEFEIANSKYEQLYMMIEISNYKSITEQDFISNIDKW